MPYRRIERERLARMYGALLKYKKKLLGIIDV